MNIRHLHYLMLFGFLATSNVSADTDIKDDFDRDVRCCITNSHIKDMVYLLLEFDDGGRKAELEVITPSKIKIGYNKEAALYYPANKQGLYALRSRTSSNIAAKKWNFTRYLLLYRHADIYGENAFQIPLAKLVPDKQYKLFDDNYQISVYGLADGNYSLSLCDDGSTLEMCNKIHTYESTNIKEGQTHTFILNGKTHSLIKK